MGRDERSRHNFTADQKVDIMRRQLSDRVPVYDLCDELKIHPFLFCFE